jgi:hypothetical protein
MILNLLIRWWKWWWTRGMETEKPHYHCCSSALPSCTKDIPFVNEILAQWEIEEESQLQDLHEAEIDLESEFLRGEND